MVSPEELFNTLKFYLFYLRGRERKVEIKMEIEREEGSMCVRERENKRKPAICWPLHTKCAEAGNSVQVSTYVAWTQPLVLSPAAS